MRRAVLVTGASSGIGRACALRLAKLGWTVYGGVRTPEAEAALRDLGVEPLVLDVTDAGQVADVAETLGESLDGLVANAGIAVAAPLELLPLDELRAQLEVNVVGQLAVVQAVLPALRRARGRIVLMGSIGGRSALPFLGPYVASKHALEAIADSLRVELRPFGVHVSIVEPGSIATPIWRKGAERADLLRERFDPERARLYSAAVERFRAVALGRGPGTDPDGVRGSGGARPDLGAAEGAVPRRPRRPPARLDRAAADVRPGPRAREGAHRVTLVAFQRASPVQDGARTSG